MKLIGVLALALALAGPAFAGEERPTSAELESEIICPVCDTTLDTSNAEIARRMKAYIRQRISAGATKSEIKAELVAQFGPRILAVPPRRGFNLLAWLLPLGAVAIGVPVLGLLAWRWSRSRADVPDEEPPDPELERRLDAELARYE